MKNQDKSLQSDAKPKMLFNSDGFEFLLKALAVLFKIMGAVLIVALNVATVLCETSSKKETEEDNSIYPIDDIVAYRDKNGTKYNADGDIL